MFCAKHCLGRINSIHERCLPLIQGTHTSYCGILLKDANQKSFTVNSKNSM